jgi:predicted O-linked N-acetylglucosamine transferase (SPINDLY family)
MNLGVIYESLGDISTAIQHHKEAYMWALDSSTRAGSLMNIARLYSDPTKSFLENTLESIGLMLRARSLDHFGVDILTNLARLYMNVNDYTSSKLILNELLLIQPRHVFGNMNIGNYHFLRNEFIEALTWYNRAVEYAKNSGERSKAVVMILNNMGQCYRELGLSQQSVEVFQIARTLAENEDLRLKLWSEGNLMSATLSANIWRNLEYLEDQLIVDMRDYMSPSGDGEHISADTRNTPVLDPFTIMLLKDTTLTDERDLAKLICKLLPKRVQQSNSWGELSVNRRLRIGYLSFDWRDHPMGRLTGRFVTHTNSSEVTSVSFSYGHNDGSIERKRIEQHSPVFVDLYGVGYDNIAVEVISSYNIDILVDLTALTYKGRIGISARKPAAVV